MTTPRDIARRTREPLAHARREAPAESRPSPERLPHPLPLYTSETDTDQPAPGSGQNPADVLGADELTALVTFQQTATFRQAAAGDSDEAEGQGPSPARMPKKPTDPSLASSFASLDAHELPMTREYSAGGLVFNDADEVALIARRSRSGHLEWCMPKGHLEKGETPEQAAIREIHEETGILGTIIGSIATIDYWFTSETSRVHKLVHHYALHQVSGELTIKGDPDHEAEDVAWVPFSELGSILSYPNERRIVWLYSRKYRSR